MIETYKK